MDGEFSQIFVNDGQPRAEKRVNKFAGCQVNKVEKLENLQLTWGLKKILAGRGSPGGVRTVPGGLPCGGEQGTLPKGEMESDGSEAPGRTTVCHECGREWETGAEEAHEVNCNLRQVMCQHCEGVWRIHGMPHHVMGCRFFAAGVVPIAQLIPDDTVEALQPAPVRLEMPTVELAARAYPHPAQGQVELPPIDLAARAFAVQGAIAPSEDMHPLENVGARTAQEAIGRERDSRVAPIVYESRERGREEAVEQQRAVSVAESATPAPAAAAPSPSCARPAEEREASAAVRETGKPQEQIPAEESAAQPRPGDQGDEQAEQETRETFTGTPRPRGGPAEIAAVEGSGGESKGGKISLTEDANLSDEEILRRAVQAGACEPVYELSPSDGRSGSDLPCGEGAAESLRDSVCGWTTDEEDSGSEGGSAHEQCARSAKAAVQCSRAGSAKPRCGGGAEWRGLSSSSRSPRGATRPCSGRKAGIYARQWRQEVDCRPEGSLVKAAGGRRSSRQGVAA